MLRQALPQDFVKYGLIPEFVGRLPVSVALDLLDKEALVRILTEPKSAIVKQYKKLFELDGVDLQFEDAAIEAIANKSLERKTGARGLRAIIESVMTDTMYTLPSDENAQSCLITKEVIDGTGLPVITYGEKAFQKRNATKKVSKKNTDEIA